MVSLYVLEPCSGPWSSAASEGCNSSRISVATPLLEMSVVAKLCVLMLCASWALVLEYYGSTQVVHLRVLYNSRLVHCGTTSTLHGLRRHQRNGEHGTSSACTWALVPSTDYYSTGFYYCSTIFNGSDGTLFDSRA